MKIILGVVAVVLVGYLAWRWYAPAPTPQSAVARAPTQREAAKPTAARPPSPKRPSPQQRAAKPARSLPATVKQPRLAPEGTYFLLQRASLRIDSGVIGFAPGTRVTMIEQNDSVSTVTDGHYQFTVPSSQLTNDLDIAENIAKSDYTVQSRIAEAIGQSVREYEQQQRDAFAASDDQKDKAKKAQKKTGQKTPRRTASPTPKR
jgi:hypothetical protein